MGVAKRIYGAFHSGRYVSPSILAALGANPASRKRALILLGDALPGAMVAHDMAERLGDYRGKPQRRRGVTQHPDLFAALAAPFDPSEVKVRTQSGRQMHYITARTAMNRLDNVLGPENWWDHYVPGENSVLCQLTIRLPDGSTLTKADAGGYAGMADSGDDDKSGYSDAFKRAAVKFGVSRYLYRDGVPTFVQERVPAGEAIQAPPEPQPAYGTPVTAPHRQAAGEGQRNGHGHSGPPRSGKALYAWTMDMEQKHEVGLLKYLNGWAKLQEFPGRMVDWTAEQAQLGYAEAVRKLESVQTQQPDTPEEEWAF